MPTLIFLAFWALLPPAASAENLRCLAGLAPTVESRPVGAETLHKSTSGTITALVPMPRASGAVLNLNSFSFESRYPERFAISDGTLRTAFVSVNQAVGSPLDRCLSELLAEIKRSWATDEERVAGLRTFIGTYLKPTPTGFLFSWDPQSEVVLPPEFAAAGKLEPGHPPLLTGLLQPSVSLESFLTVGFGVCVEKVLFTSLLMKRLGIAHQVRAGGTKSSGHIWIELADGRILDPTWELLQLPSHENAPPNWFGLDHSLLFADQFFPLIAD